MEIQSNNLNGYINMKLVDDNISLDMSYEDIDSMGAMIKELYSAICYKIGGRFYNWDDGKKYIDELLGLEIKNLQHHYDSTIGLHATDKPEMIPEALKEYFFEIK